MPPAAAPRWCPRCLEPHAGPCSLHQRAPDRRPSAAVRGYDSRWRLARDGFLRENPLCEGCARNGRSTLATVVDHIIPHRGDPVLFWDRNNWQPLCERCHNAKSAREQHGGT